VPAFIEAHAPTDDELHALLQTWITRPMKRLARRGVLVEVERSTCVAASDAGWNEANDVCFAAGVSTAPLAAQGRLPARRTAADRHPILLALARLEYPVVTGRLGCVAVVQLQGAEDCNGTHRCHPVRKSDWQLTADRASSARDVQAQLRAGRTRPA
jgi:hypothetical protein